MFVVAVLAAAAALSTAHMGARAQHSALLAQPASLRPRAAALARMATDDGGGGMRNLADIVGAADDHLLARGPQPSSVRARRQRASPSRIFPPASDSILAWIVLCKPTIRDQLSLEQAARVHAALRRLREGERPQVICFCGGGLLAPPSSSDAPPRSRLSAPAVAYHFFRSAAEAQAVEVKSVR